MRGKEGEERGGGGGEGGGEGGRRRRGGKEEVEGDVGERKRNKRIESGKR